jgi:hypothetical protein
LVREITRNPVSDDLVDLLLETECVAESARPWSEDYSLLRRQTRCGDAWGTPTRSCLDTTISSSQGRIGGAVERRMEDK